MAGIRGVGGEGSGGVRGVLYLQRPSIGSGFGMCYRGPYRLGRRVHVRSAG